MVSIQSQIHVPDIKGYASLFQAEMFRIKRTLDDLKARTGPCLLVVDEIFNSTNPVEGMAAGYAVARRMNQYPHVITVLSTHYGYLTRVKGRFRRMRMEVDMGPPIRFPYRLTKGVSRQYIALELMKQHGFEEELMDEAIEVKDALMGVQHTASST